MYHSIGDNSKSSVKIKSFTEQISLMKKLGYKSINLCELGQYKDYNKKIFVITFDDGYKDVFTNAYPILRAFNFKATCFFVFNKIGKFNEWDIDYKKFEKKKIMTEDDLKKWDKNGFEVGSHSLDHQNLIKIDDKEKTIQIVKSKDFFKRKYNINIKSFSYPFGLYNESVVKIVKKNFDYAVTTKRSRYKENLHENILIPRIPINPKTSMLKFMLKILTPYEDIKFKL